MCAWRQLVADYSARLRPDSMTIVREALEFDHYCNGTTLPEMGKAEQEAWAWPPSVKAEAVDESTIYADPVHGNDLNTGTFDKPVKTVQKAVDLTARTSGPRTIMLRNGTFHMREAVHLNETFSHVTIQNYPGEEVWLSGGVRLNNLQWQAYKVDGVSTIWKVGLNTD